MSAPEAPNFDPEMHEPAPPRKRRRWILAILLGLCLTCCCATSGLFFYAVRWLEISTDEQLAVRRASGILEFRPPKGMQAFLSMRPPVDDLKFTEVIWIDRGSDPPGFLVLAEAPDGTSAETVWRMVEEQMRMIGFDLPVTLDPPQEKPFTVRGKATAFQFSKGTSDGKPIRQVRGIAPSKGGRALFWLRVSETSHDAAEVEAILRSME